MLEACSDGMNIQSSTDWYSNLQEHHSEEIMFHGLHDGSEIYNIAS